MNIINKSNKSKIDKFCEQNNIIRLSLFGSYQKKSYKKNSDIDLLVEFKKSNKIGLLDIARMERELSEILKLKVDLRTPEELSNYFRNNVVKEAEIKYEAGR